MIIISPADDEPFDFTKLSLTYPTTNTAGTFFTKILYNNEILYIETPKCQTKQGFVKNAKKYNCELMINIENNTKFINWVEEFEIYCHKLIFEKTNDWFQGSLTHQDIKSAFNKIIKPYRTGKFNLIKTNIQNSSNGDISVNIYDETENIAIMSDIKQNTQIVSIVEIQGIKFNNKNFQVDIELKQAMIINYTEKENLFNKCLIKKHQPTEHNIDIYDDIDAEQCTDVNTNTQYNISIGTTSYIEPDNLSFKTDTNDIPIETDDIPIETDDIPIETDNIPIETDDIPIETDDIPIVIQSEVNNIPCVTDNISIEPNNACNHLEQHDFNLKPKTIIYNDLYKKAKEHAKHTKKQAVFAYLEAKRIKEEYLIDDDTLLLTDSDNE